VILHAVEISTGLLMGMPALLKEGMSWREIKLRAMHTTPVTLSARPAAGARRAGRSGSPAQAEG
jgi:phosphatidylinositol alpha-mannosyltransferase